MNIVARSIDIAITTLTLSALAAVGGTLAGVGLLQLTIVISTALVS